MALRLCVAGCGAMGMRHVAGLAQLHAIGNVSMELVALCDPDETRLAAAAAQAETLLGRRPHQLRSLEEARASSIDVVDIVTRPDTHVSLGLQALDAGWNVLVEKPIATTLRDGATLVDRASGLGLVLAVAENYRRDPMNRLGKALITAGAIGEPYLLSQLWEGLGRRVLMAPWRHQLEAGGPLLDVGVHYVDLFEYFLGPVELAWGSLKLVHAARLAQDGSTHEADAPDVLLAGGRFASGALFSLILNIAAEVPDRATRMVYGTEGTLELPNDRTGNPPSLRVSGGRRIRTVKETQLLSFAPGYELDETTARLFGEDRPTRYHASWSDADARLIAVELDDLARAIIDGRAPEVTGKHGLRSLDIVLAMLGPGDANSSSFAIDTETTAAASPVASG